MSLNINQTINQMIFNFIRNIHDENKITSNKWDQWVGFTCR